MARERLVLLAAGGTGGHLFPAQALAHALIARDIRIVLATDARVSDHIKDFPAEAVYEVPSATPSRQSPGKMMRAAAIIAHGVWRVRGLVRAIRPACVIGFGGYPSVPPVLAGVMAGVPTIIHEQNAVMGRANRLLAPRVTAIATGFDRAGLTGALAGKAIHVGNPVRRPVLEAAATPYPAPGETLRLVIFGGSQGARVMADIVPHGVLRLPPVQRARLAITQQARAEDKERVATIYADCGVAAEVEPFFADLPQRIAQSHLVIARAGASTIAELAAIGRPSILVPLPGALDQDQAANAESLGAIGAATVIRQSEFTPERLADELSARLAEPDRLTRAAEAAKSAGIPDAAERLAKLVIAVGRIEESRS